MSSYVNQDALVSLLRGESDQPHLDLAALELARIEFPDLCPETSLAGLDSLASQLAGRVTPSASLMEFVRHANHLLFVELGFRGNDEDYYNPRNSCLNHVLLSRRGIPITLALLYMELGRRLGRRLEGIGLPGHFILRASAPEGPIYIDAFHGGALLTPHECRQLAQRSSGVDIAGDLRFLEPVTKRQMLVRMLYNLRSIYFSRRAWAKCRAVLDLILLAQPEAALEHRQRAAVNAQLGRFSAAIQDLRQYLRYTRDDSDAAEVQAQLQSLQRCRASLQ